MKTKKMAIASLVALSVSAPAFAAKEAVANKSTEESKSLIQQLKDSPFSLSSVLENYTTLNLEEFNGSRLDTGISYKLSDNDVLKSAVRLKVNESDGDYETTFSYAHVGYQRKGLLKNDKHGLDLGLQTRLYKYAEGASADGAVQVRFDLGKKFSDKLSSGGVAIYEEYLNPKSGKSNRLTYFEGGPTLNVNNKLDLTGTLIVQTAFKKDSQSTYGSLSVTPSYKLTEKVSLSHEAGVDRDFSGDATTYGVNINPSVSYSMNDQLSASLDYETQVGAITDGKAYGRQWLTNGKLTLAMAYSL